MKVNARTLIYLALVIIVGAGIFLWSEKGKSDALNLLDKSSFDVSTSCNKIEGNNLICNGENDIYLFLDDVDVYIKDNSVSIDKDGNLDKVNEFKQYSLKKLVNKVESDGCVSLYLWFTSNGKVKTIMVVNRNYQNNSSNIDILGGIDPSSYMAECTILGIEGNKLQTNSIHYDGDEKNYYERFDKEYEISNNVNCFNVSVNTFINKDGKQNSKVEYMKSTLAEIKDNLEVLRKTAYIWFNDKGEISIIMTVDDSEIWE